MANDSKFTPGMNVWVIERDEDGNACDINCCVFLAHVQGVVILSPYVNDYDFDGILAYHVQCTEENYDTNLFVLPDEDCFVNKEDCAAALKLEQEGE